jgi:ABC-type enterochelin transport system substrate-binding protein
MLEIYLTKNGTSVSIFGDYGNLNSLYQAVYNTPNSTNANNKKHGNSF